MNYSLAIDVPKIAAIGHGLSYRRQLKKICNLFFGRSLSHYLLAIDHVQLLSNVSFIMFAYEMVHSMKRMKGNKGCPSSST